MKKEELIGKSKGHLVQVNGGPHHLHKDVLSPFIELQNMAKSEGIELALASSFRDFERQLLIWNNKASGKRTILDSSGNPLNFEELSNTELLFSILRWSAIPGLSRHHWGTDIDIYDINGLPSRDYQLQLTEEEYASSGIFGKVGDWLDEMIETNKCSFFRPYSSDRGGVALERWHLSFAPVADQLQKELSLDLYFDVVKSNDILLKDELLAHGEEIFERYIINTEESGK